MKLLAEELGRAYPSVPLIYGGPFASLPDQWPIFFDLLHATAVVRGEGEDAFPQLIAALSDGDIGRQIPGVAWNALDQPSLALASNAANPPLPARHLLENQRYRPSLRRNIFDGPITAIYLSRGCPYHCSFCVSPLLRGHRVARRTNADLFAEMRHCIDAHNITGFIFYDDCLFLKSKRLNTQVQEFCRQLTENVGSVRWEMELRCDAVAALTSDSIEALYHAGCRQINMGIEKASDQHLKGLNKRLTAAEIVAACQNVQAVMPDLRLAGTFILGGAAESEADVYQLIEFAETLPLDFAHFYPLEVYPGTALFTEYMGNTSPTAWAYAMLQDLDNYWGEIIYETPALDKARLLELTHEAYQRFYARPTWLRRFAATTTPEVYHAGLRVVERWCEDRFHLAPHEVDDAMVLA
jgi:radical SAM superfamily enzyme YgiQ (UPF0313 family)